jgi:5-deoxy-glucuronate isomerase
MCDFETIASPERGESSFLTLHRLQFSLQGQSWSMNTDEAEHVLDIFSGTCQIRGCSRANENFDFHRVGSRENIFFAPPDLVYLPRQTSYEISCIQGPCEMVIYSAPTDEDSHPTMVSSKTVKCLDAGTSDWSRRVYIGLGEDSPTTRMMVGETHSPPGNWSSFPPHRHQKNQPPDELALEELYYFKFDRKQGFAIGGIYQDPQSAKDTMELKTIGDGEIFDVPGGYHFIAPCPAYRLSYSWALGGKQKGFGLWVTDPNHSWIAEL